MELGVHLVLGYWILFSAAAVMVVGGGRALGLH